MRGDFPFLAKGEGETDRQTDRGGIGRGSIGGCE
jgi:hypothetical protein